jgi:hypothetical protein
VPSSLYASLERNSARRCASCRQDHNQMHRRHIALRTAPFPRYGWPTCDHRDENCAICFMEPQIFLATCSGRDCPRETIGVPRLVSDERPRYELDRHRPHPTGGKQPPRGGTRHLSSWPACHMPEETRRGSTRDDRSTSAALYRLCPMDIVKAEVSYPENTEVRCPLCTYGRVPLKVIPGSPPPRRRSPWACGPAVSPSSFRGAIGVPLTLMVVA